MAAGDKPYRVYRGGRTKGKVPLQGRPARERDGGGRSSRGGGNASGGGNGSDRKVVRRPRRRWGWRRRIGLGLVVLLLLALAWGVASWLAVGKGVKQANARLPVGTRSALAGGNGLLVAHSTDILLLGTDHSGNASRSGLRHSDSIMLLRTDPGRHRLVYLSIPRDLRVPIPGHGSDKINAAMQIGGPALAARTVASFTGLPVNHIVIVDFASFEKLIDKIGGVDINVPANILSNRFDCPYATSTRCLQWEGWRFQKGVQHMGGHRALIYSRVRENRLNPSESDVTRGERQQQVLQAMMSKLASVGTLGKLPFMGGDLLAPISTDMSTWTSCSSAGSSSAPAPARPSTAGSAAAPPTSAASRC
jgi:LCP family protein required for cell wall assembly